MRVSYDRFVELAAKLDVSRSSHNWQTFPGNWDKLNTHTMYSSGNRWGIPDLPPATVVPQRLIAYNDRHACDTSKPGAAIHFFLDDYRFETMWTKPQRGLSRVIRAGLALTPDFSLWRDMPLAMQLWQVYRSRWCGCWMASSGVKVIPTVSWSTPASYDFAFAGIPEGSVVAISSVGIRGDEAQFNYRHGVKWMLADLNPATVVVYGRSLGEDKMWPHVDFRYYKTRWDM
jgi:hypothetical protein